MTAAGGAAVTGSIGFVALERSAFSQGSDYIGNKKGNGYLCDPGSLYIPEPLNIDANLSPVPFWNSVVWIDGDKVEFITWTLNFSQEVVKFFTCESNSDPVEPRFMAVGPMTAQFTGDYFFYSMTPTLWNIPDSVSTLTVNIAGEVINLEELELTTDSDDVRGQNDQAVIAVDYAAYKLVA
jgi:hypothetical protein